MRVKVLLIIATLAVLAAGATIGWHTLATQMDEPGANSAAVRFEVQPGTRLRTILASLQQRGVLRHPSWLQLYLRISGQRPRVQAGIYEIAPRATARHVLEQLVEGRVLLESITIVEGWSFAQMRQA